jgi:hypothetical protein
MMTEERLVKALGGKVFTPVIENLIYTVFTPGVAQLNDDRGL